MTELTEEERLRLIFKAFAFCEQEPTVEAVTEQYKRETGELPTTSVARHMPRYNRGEGNNGSNEMEKAEGFMRPWVTSTSDASSARAPSSGPASVQESSG